MAYTTINKSSLNMNTKLYNGSGSNQSLTGLGFKPDWIWGKTRSNAQRHVLTDVVRGINKQLASDTTAAETSYTNSFTAFGSDGFSVGTDNGTNMASQTQVAWCWKAGTAVSGNSGGSGTAKSYSGSVNATAGFSIIKYTGNGTSGHTIPHHLGSVPAMIIFKQLNATRGWGVYHQSRGAGKIIYLDESIAEQSANILTGTPNSSVMSLPSLNENNINDASYIAYCFAEKQGYSKFGSYKGNGNADGAFVYTGFKPAFVMIKRSDGSASWEIRDNKRKPFPDGNGKRLFPDSGSAESSNSEVIEKLSNGFKIRSTGAGHNANNGNYIYMAFAEAPLVGTNNVPCTAR